MISPALIEPHFHLENSVLPEFINHSGTIGEAIKVYEQVKDNQKTMNAGKPFQKAYDVETLKPSSEWQNIYDEVCQELVDDFELELDF
jgi:hypothetical protein